MFIGGDILPANGSFREQPIWIPSQGSGSFSLVINVAAGGTSNTVITSAVDTSGANLLIACIADFAGSGSPASVISDNKGNSWTVLSESFVSGDNRTRIAYSFASSVGAGHTFSADGSNAFPSLCVAAFSGGSAFDMQNGSSNSGLTSIQPGSITAGSSPALIISGLSLGGPATTVIGSGFTITDQINYSGGNHFFAALSYLIQSSAIAVNPTWSWSGGMDAAARIASFI